MDNIEVFSTSMSNIFNYPLVVLGKSSITLSMILFNIMFLLIFLYLISRAKNWIIEALSKRSDFKLSNWQASITLIYYAVMVFGIFGILQSTGLDLSLFTVLTGAIGIGVGFGMQSIFSNFISGIILLMERPLKPGDRIEVGSVAGNVQNISARATTILTNDNVAIIIPNSEFVTKQIINWSHSGKSVRINIPISVSLECDPNFVERLLLEIANKEHGVLKTPAPEVHLNEFGDGGLRFGLLVWTEIYSDRTGALKSLLNNAVLKSFREKKIAMTGLVKEIHVHNITKSELVAPLDGLATET